ncbi:MAG: hypothetical protein JNK94_00860 [Hyphomonadaceae bacterium]|nr:hypothetical protein [Hyphomonadaceae bacterium]
MIRSIWAAVAALALIAAPAPAYADIPQHLIDALARLTPYHTPPESLSGASAASIQSWREAAAADAPADEVRRLAAFAARDAFRAGDDAAAAEAAAAVASAPSAPAASVADAALVIALTNFRRDAASEPALAAALSQASAASPEFRSETARQLALAHMRRDQQAEALAHWRTAEDAARNMGRQTYHFELALLGRAASHGYSNQLAEGLAALQTLMDRMQAEIARLNAVREISPGENIYAQALAWRAAFRLDPRSDYIEVPGYVQVGSASIDSLGQQICRGRFVMRPAPHFPLGAQLYRLRGVAVLRLSTDANGQVIHAEAVAAVPATPAFSRVSLSVAPRWRYVPARDLGADETPCRLQSEGQLAAWSFH